MQNNGFCTVKEPVLPSKTGSFALPKRLHQKDAERPTLPIMPNIPMSSYNPSPQSTLLADSLTSSSLLQRPSFLALHGSLIPSAACIVLVK